MDPGLPNPPSGSTPGLLHCHTHVVITNTNTIRYSGYCIRVLTPLAQEAAGELGAQFALFVVHLVAADAASAQYRGLCVWSVVDAGGGGRWWCGCLRTRGDLDDWAHRCASRQHLLRGVHRETAAADPRSRVTWGCATDPESAAKPVRMQSAATIINRSVTGQQNRSTDGRVAGVCV